MKMLEAKGFKYPVKKWNNSYLQTLNHFYVNSEIKNVKSNLLEITENKLKKKQQKQQ